MKIPELLYIPDRNVWRAWLKRHHAQKKEVWLVYFKKHTNKSWISYDDAVEEALCFGWIDSTVKRLDSEKYAQKYTPRKRNSIWSNSNIKRARKMIRQRKMTKAGLTLFNEFLKRPRKDPRTRIMKKRIVTPPDLKAALQQNHKAAKNFKAFAPSYRRMYIWYIISAKKEETRRRRIKKIVQLASQNKKGVML